MFAAAELARRRRDAGLRLNHPEAVALIADAMLEAARAGRRLRRGRGRRARTRSSPAEVLDGVRELLDDVRVEVLFGDGDTGRRARRSARPAARRPTRSDRARCVIGDPSDVVDQRGPGGDRARGHEPLGAADPRLVALPVRAGQPAARVRPRRRPRASAWTCRPGRTPAGSRARRRPSGSCATGGTRRRGGDRDDAPVRRGVPDPLWRDHGRPDPARRHRPLGPRRRGSHRPRRRAGVGLREEPALADGAVGRRRRARPSSTSSSPARSSSTP